MEEEDFGLGLPAKPFFLSGADNIDTVSRFLDNYINPVNINFAQLAKPQKQKHRSN